LTLEYSLIFCGDFDQASVSLSSRVACDSLVCALISPFAGSQEARCPNDLGCPPLLTKPDHQLILNLSANAAIMFLSNYPITVKHRPRIENVLTY
jgi:hypothetical protein